MIKKFSAEVRLFDKIFKNKKKPQYLEIYMKFSLKIGLLSLFFFLQGYSEMKMKIRKKKIF